ncbi:hypothetical protein ACZ87_01917 [Candidatus Erwinia dacicola]|nr:hypothetical protein ACZ87_01917 [Candidatus Erwinia dacicola]
MEFTKEQLIAHIAAKASRIKPDLQVNDSLRIEALMNKRVLEIALASLTVPDDIPPHVLDAMSDMCDAGYHTASVHMPSIDSPGFTSWADDWHGITLEDGIEVEED